MGSDNTVLTPIVLFVYNRPDYTQRVLNSLSENLEAKESILYVYCDGPKADASETLLEKIKKTRAIVQQENRFKEIRIVEQQSNKGLSNSIIEGVSSICNEYGSVIVLEDDIITSPFFLRYMNDALLIYKYEEQVSSISGYWYPTNQKMPETFFLQDASCWGWATWSRAWKNFEADGSKLYAEIIERNLSKKFDMYGTRYKLMLQYQIEGVNDSWAIRWDAGNFLSNRVSLYPGISLTQNIGFDGSGVHCPDIDYYDVTLADRPVNVELLPVIESKLAQHTLIKFYKDMKRDIVKKKIIGIIQSYMPAFLKRR